MIKTVELSGTELEVTDLDRNNTLVVNNSDASVFASNKPGVEAYKDGVIEIPAGARDTVVGTNGTVYVLGKGRIELRGVDFVGFKMPSSSGGTSGGGGGETCEKGAYCGITEFVNSNEGVKSTTIEYSSDFPERLAEILAAETGWELQADGVTVLKDGGVGFKFTSTHVWLANDLGSPYDYNFQYINGSTSSGITIDICKSSGGAVAFGCRALNSDGTEKQMSFQFVLAQNSKGEDIVLAEYQSYQAYMLSKSKSSGEIITIRPLSKNPAAVSTALSLLPDDTSGCLFVNVFYLTIYPSGMVSGIFSIDGKRFRLLKSTAYSSETPLFAVPI